ncbi:MAG: anaerobic ribonucleoside-triphosphate reductase activating protein [Eubacteriales bacterium]
MRYAQIRKCDIANGAGIRTSLYIQGCSRHCKGCFNPETWDFQGGKPWTEDVEREFLNLIGKPHIVGVTILGGEPLEPQSRAGVLDLLQKIRQRYPKKNIWIYSSYVYEELLEECREILENIDVLVDGMFVEELKDARLKFRGSSNQRVIDVVKSLQEGGDPCHYS